jgi:hypothetical protein
VPAAELTAADVLAASYATSPQALGFDQEL